MRRKGICLFLVALFFWAEIPSAMAAEDLTAYFEAARAALETPAQQALTDGEWELRTGETVAAPFVSTEVIPYDEQAERPLPALEGELISGDESILSVSEDGMVTALSAGETTLTYRTSAGEQVLKVSVSDDAMPQLIRNYIYVLRREFTEVQRARLPKYNKYAKWYYRKKNEVGWCSVFTIYCANAAGAEPVKKGDVDKENPPEVQFLREGQVGNQYDGFLSMGRFVGIPQSGYLVIYADMSNEYRTVHIGSVVDVEDRGDGVYAVTTIEGNMSNSVKSYSYLYDSKLDNHLVGVEKGLRLRSNMAERPESEQVDPLIQYALHTDHWSVFGFCQTWAGAVPLHPTPRP